MVDPAINICKKMKSQDEEECERLWFYLLDNLQLLCQQHTKNRVIISHLLSIHIHFNTFTTIISIYYLYFYYIIFRLK